MPKLSVILCTRNPQAKPLQATLDALANQTLPRSEWEMVMVDNGSAPALETQSEGWPLPARLVVEPRPGLTLARVAGIRVSSGGLLVFVDDDNALDPDYLAQVVQIFGQDSTLGACGGRVTAVLDGPVPNNRHVLLPWLAGAREMGPQPVYSPPTERGWGPWEPFGAGLACRRQVADYYAKRVEQGTETRRLGRTHDQLMSGEDVLLARGVYHLGLRMANHPALHLRHHLKASRLNMDYLRRLMFGTGRSMAILERMGHPGTAELPRPSDLDHAALLLARSLDACLKTPSRPSRLRWWYHAGFALERINQGDLPLADLMRWRRQAVAAADRPARLARQPIPPKPDLDAMRTDIATLLLPLRGEDVWYCANIGNAGDALIAAATRQLFHRIGLKVREVRLEDPIPPGKVVLYGGGGNLVDDYPHAAGFIARHHRDAKLFVLLPHTVRAHEALLGQLGSNALLVCRDLPSLNHVKKHAPQARVAAADDLVFGLHPGALWLQTLKKTPRLLFNPEARRLLKASWKFGFRPASHLRILRADVESANNNHSDETDLSAILMTDVHHVDVCDLAASLFLLPIALARKTDTDRLHVGIAGAILNRRVRLHDNSYGKNGVVWAASMGSAYPHVSFVPALCQTSALSAPRPTSPATPPLRHPTTTCLVNNYNYEKFVVEAVASALAQTIPFDEIIVVDDGSTDNSIARLQAAFGDHPKVKIITKPNGGQLSAFNRGFMESSGDILFFLDADDLYAPAMLEKTLDVYRHRPQLGMVFGPVILFDQVVGIDFVRANSRNHPIRFVDGTSYEALPDDHRREILFDGGRKEALISQRWIGSPTSTLSLRRGALARLMPLPHEADWRTRADDCLLFGAALMNIPRCYQPEPLARYRIHGNNAWFAGKAATPEQERRRQDALTALFDAMMRQLGELAPHESIESLRINLILEEYGKALPFNKGFRRGWRAFQRAGLPKPFVRRGRGFLLRNAFGRLLGISPAKMTSSA